VIYLIGELFRKGIKENKFVEKAIMTGILRLSKANIFSGLNSFSEQDIN